MITYEKYASIRDLKHMKDADVAKSAGIPQSTFSDWKKGKSIPKIDKLIKISNALGIGYNELVGAHGLHSSLNPNRPVKISVEAKYETQAQELVDLFKNATPDAQTSVMTLLKNSQKEGSASSKEA